jgi:hypothetical protein
MDGGRVREHADTIAIQIAKVNKINNVNTGFSKEKYSLALILNEPYYVI